jgi:hypothetical protein
VKYLLTIIGVAALALAAAPGPTPAGAEVHVSHPTAVSTNPVDNTPHVLDGTVKAVLEVGNRVIVGGQFTRVKKWSRPGEFTRVGIFAYDKRTGDIDLNFAPVLDGEVRDIELAPDGSVLVGGWFTNVNGGPFIGGITKLDPNTGQAVAGYKGHTNGRVNDIAVVGTTAYIGGTFTKMRQFTRSLLGAITTTTGDVVQTFDIPVTTAIKNTAHVFKVDVTPDGSRMVILGNFKSVGGQPRDQVAMINLASPAQVSTWQTDGYRGLVCASSYDMYVRDVDFAPDGSYFVIVTTGAWRGTSTLCDTAARWETNREGPGQQPTWVDYTGGDSLTAVAVTGAVVYVAGHQRWHNNAIPPRGDVAGPGAVVRYGIAALDPESGTTLSWSIQRDRGITVGVMVEVPDGLYIGSDSGRIGNEWHPRLAFLPLAGGTPVTRVVHTNLPATVANGGGSTAPGSKPTTALTTRSYSGASFGAPVVQPADGTDWSTVRGIVRADGRTYRFLSDGTYRVSVGGGSYQPVSSWITFTGITGATYDRGRLFTTKTGDPKLYARGFAADWGLVNTLELIVSGNGDGMDWSGTKGIAAIAGKLYHAQADGNLYRTDLVNGAPVAATTVVVSGPAVGDGQNWSKITGLHASS